MRLAILVVLALSGTAHAQQAGAEDWVGGWAGKARSKGCVDGIPKKLALDVTLTAEGTLRSNGDVIVEGWGDLDWLVDGKTLVLQNQGLTGSLTRSGKRAKLVLTSDAGCLIKATLERATSGIASCDRLRVLATVKAQCPALPAETRGESLTEVEASWSAWGKLKGKKRKAQATSCTEKAATLATETASCRPGAVGVTGFAECDTYLAMIDRYVQCQAVPQAARDAAQQGRDAMRAAWGQSTSLPEEAKAAIRDACKQAVAALQQGASAMGCSL